MKTAIILLLVLLAAGVVSGQQGRGFDFAAHEAVMDSRPVWTACGAGLDYGFSGITMA